MIRSSISAFARLAVATSVLGLFAAGCAAETTDGEGAELWDEGPPADDADTGAKEEVGSVSEALSIASFQLPFPCGQVWSGQTRTNHSPINSIDFNRSGDEGDSVVAAAAGTISRVQNLGSRSYGLWIEINHGGGYVTRYAHLSSESVSVGQRVARGQRIGAVGNTGGSSGAHLHFEIRRNGADVRVAFDGATALYFGTRSYTSKNCPKAGGGGGGSGASGRIETSGASVDIRLKWFPTMLTNVTLDGGRSIEETTVDGAASLVSTRGEVRVDHELLRNLIFSGSMGYENQEFTGGLRNDDILRGAVSGRYMINNNIHLDAGWEFVDRTSSDVPFSYSASQFQFSLTGKM